MRTRAQNKRTLTDRSSTSYYIFTIGAKLLQAVYGVRDAGWEEGRS